jgi:membrane-associated phospholipid phosphatase
MGSAPPDSSASTSAPRRFFVGPITDFAQDQERIWTSPARIRLIDARWLVPLAGVTAGLFVTDQQYSASLSTNPNTINHYKTITNVGIASLAGAGAGMYLMSFPAHNEHWRETGFLAGEAALDALIPIEVMKYSFGRERPYQGNGSGAFFQGGTSFPSEHSAAAWAIAGVFAHEYSGIFPKLVSYGLASAVSFARVHGKQHFPSDVFVGSMLGYLISQSVYSRRHDPELRGSAWASPREFVEEGEKLHSPAHMGSPYVQLDSWIYPALERLAAMGYVKTAIVGLRPWTRLECARLVMEASQLQPEEDAPLEVQQLYIGLSLEFASELEIMSGESNSRAQLESVYQRSLGISGKPLTDNQHFGQTLLNDYGRPFEEGFNTVAGASGWATAGPFVIYSRGEYQYSPSSPALPQNALDFIASVDDLPPNPPATPTPASRSFRVLDAYVGMTLANWQLSFGRQSQWWGPSEGGAMLYTNNAEPLNNMFRIDRVQPFQLPWLFRYLGDIRLQLFLGQFSGHRFLNNNFEGGGAFVGQYGQSLHPQPTLSGGKISLKLTENFEFGMTKTTVYGGPGNPVTLKTIFQSTFAVHVHNAPLGDGRSGADFSYRIPKLRDWVSCYGEAMSEDQPSPIPYMRQSIFQGGLYFAKIPRIPKVDLRLEGGSTSAVNYDLVDAANPGYFYWNNQYVDGYTNDGRTIGSWIGRAAQGESVRTNYWLSAKNKIGLELRHRQIDQKFLPQGGSQDDVAVNAVFFTRSGFSFSSNLQYERWFIPMLATTPQSNFAASFQFGFWPRVPSH